MGGFEGVAKIVCRDEVGGLEVVFIGIGEADSFIVREAQSLRTAGCPYVSPCPVIPPLLHM